MPHSMLRCNIFRQRDFGIGKCFGPSLRVPQVKVSMVGIPTSRRPGNAMAPTDISLPARFPDATRHLLELIGFGLTLAYVLFLADSAIHRYWLIDDAGQAIANDFVNVWAAGQLALAGQPAAAYDWTAHREVEVAAIGHDFAGYYGWHYPPTFLFAAAALAILPYLPALLLWVAVTLPAYVTTVRAVIGERLGLILACGFPGVIWNASVGQNGFLTAALIGAVLMQMEKRPAVSGICLGLLTYKPQFGILFPFVLACDGRWRLIAFAAATTAALGAASLLAFGTESWHAFLAWMPVTSAAVFADGRAGLNKLQSLLGVVRWLGGGMPAAWIAQGALIAFSTVAVAALWRRPVRYEIKAAALAVGALLATPYLYIYDFPVLAIPLAFLLRLGLREGFLPYELSAMAVASGLVLAFPFVAMPTGFAAIVIVAVMVARRVLVGHTLRCAAGTGGATAAR
jgi:arabinofuranan 3-O-arabinosyltransferase